MSNRKLTPEQVDEIRQLTRVACPHCGIKPTQASVARKYGVSKVTIHFIAHDMRSYGK